MTDPAAGSARPDSAIRHIESLVAANEESNATMRRLVENVRNDAHMRERKIDLLEHGLHQTRQVMLVVIASLVLLVLIGVVNFATIQDARRNAAVTAQTAKDAQRTYATLEDCLNQAGKCGQSSARQQKQALDEIKKYELTTIYCARSNPQPIDPKGTAFLSCVNRLYPGGPPLNGK